MRSVGQACGLESLQRTVAELICCKSVTQLPGENVFRGNHSVSIDSRGRVRLPVAFLTPLRQEYGDDVFLTSISGECMRIYPFEIWLHLENRLKRIPSMDVSRSRLLSRFTFFGQQGRLDKVGRVTIPPILRERAALEGEVAVLGQLDFIEVWNTQRFFEKLDAEPLTDKDRKLLAELGI